MGAAESNHALNWLPILVRDRPLILVASLAVAADHRNDLLSVPAHCGVSHPLLLTPAGDAPKPLSELAHLGNGSRTGNQGAKRQFGPDSDLC
jgi:hypothetical protein